MQGLNKTDENLTDMAMFHKYCITVTGTKCRLVWTPRKSEILSL